MQLKQEELMKSRGYRATIQAAYNMFTDNFKVIFKHVWPFTLAFAVIMGFIVLNQVSMYSYQPLAPKLFLISGALGILAAAAEVVYYGRILMMLNDRSMSWNMIRTAKAILWEMLLIGIIFLIVGGSAGLAAGLFSEAGEGAAETMSQTDPVLLMQQQQMVFLKSIGVGMAVSLVIGILLLPFVYIFMKYFVEPESHFHRICLKGWKTGMRHWGYLFLTLLLVMICLWVVALVIFLPFSILVIAYTLSSNGVATGDEAGVPGYFNVLTYAVSVVSCFVCLLLSVFLLFVFYYIYGSIETRERERKKAPLEVTAE